MTWLAVAKKDFREAVQSRALWALVVVFVLVSVASTYAYTEVPGMFGSQGGATFDGLILFTVGFTGLFVPLAAIVVCYKSLAGERELGSIKLLLSLPTNRRDVFVGKVLGRAAVIAVGLVAGLLVGLGAAALLLGGIDVAASLVFVLVSLAFAVVYAGIMVSISASTGSTSRATTLALGFFAIFELFWDVVPLAVVYVVEGFQLPAQMPDWVYPVMQLSPSAAYFSAVTAVVPGLTATSSGGGAGVGVQLGGDAAPIYLSPEIGLVILLFWLVVPLAIGYRRFETADL